MFEFALARPKEIPMRKAPMIFVAGLVGLALSSVALGETVKLQVKGAY
jgi:hypothetical protein